MAGRDLLYRWPYPRPVKETSRSCLRSTARSEEHCHTANLSVIASQCQSSSLCRLRDISLRPEGVFPDRGAIGRSGNPCWTKKFYLAQKIVLRCPGKRHLNYALTKGVRTDAVSLDSGALPFTVSRKPIHPAQPIPARQWLPYQGSCRAVGETERFEHYKKTES